MSGAIQSSNKLDVPLNLVPFIDLLSTLTLFLLVTAVWLQIAAIPAAVNSKGKSTVAKVDEQRLVIHMTEGGMQLSWPGSLRQSGYPSAISKVRGSHDTSKLTSILAVLAKSGKLPSIAVGGSDTVPYGAVIEAIDAAKMSGAPSVALNTE